jgi:hypothetical protein
VVAAALALLALDADAQKRCTKGKPCGNTCIALDKDCHVGQVQAPEKRAQPTATPASGYTPAPRSSGPSVHRCMIDGKMVFRDTACPQPVAESR